MRRWFHSMEKTSWHIWVMDVLGSVCNLSFSEAWSVAFNAQSEMTESDERITLILIITPLRVFHTYGCISKHQFFLSCVQHRSLPTGGWYSMSEFGFKGGNFASSQVNSTCTAELTTPANTQLVDCNKITWTNGSSRRLSDIISTRPWSCRFSKCPVGGSGLINCLFVCILGLF